MTDALSFHLICLERLYHLRAVDASDNTSQAQAQVQYLTEEVQAYRRQVETLPEGERKRYTLLLQMLEALAMQEDRTGLDGVVSRLEQFLNTAHEGGGISFQHASHAVGEEAEDYSVERT